MAEKSTPPALRVIGDSEMSNFFDEPRQRRDFTSVFMKIMEFNNPHKGFISRRTLSTSRNQIPQRTKLIGKRAISNEYYRSVSAATPGSTLPSMNSSDAPPPVDTCETLSDTPAWSTDEAESPPPITSNRLSR